MKYLGAKAFAAPLAEAFRRAKLASYLDLTIKERLILLKTWVLPVLLLTARAYVADHTTPSTLTNIHNILFSFDSWGVTLHQLSQTKEYGGYALPLAHTWLMAQAGLPVVAHIAETCIFPPAPVRDFRRWCNTIGLVLKPHFLPVTQLGTPRKPWQPRCFLACSLQAFSEARRFTVDRLAFENVRALPV